MTPREGRLRPAFDTRALPGPRRPASALVAAVLGLVALAQVSGSVASAAPQAGARRPRVPTLYHKNRSFRIPFNVEPADRPRLKEVQLWVSEDSGFTWKTVSRTTPDRPAFTFRAARDAEFWFAVRTLDNKGVLYPGEDDRVEPSMKVVVDTTVPSILLEPDGRRGSIASVRWEVKDEHLDLKSLVIEYQAEGARDWRQVPIRRPGLIGTETWDAGTAEPVKVRASVSDRAGNLGEFSLLLSDGTPTNPSLAARNTDVPDYAAASPIAAGASSLPPADEAPAMRPAPRRADPFPFPAQPDWGGGGGNPPGGNATTQAPAMPPAFAVGNDPFGGSNGPSEPATAPATPQAAPAPAPTPGPAPAAPAAKPILVSSPRFPLKYEVDEAGPDGPASVQLWVTQDGGRTWYPRGEDVDRTSPFDVDLGGEGTFGLRVVARSASGLGDNPPAPNDPPHILVEVDRSPPQIQLFPTVAGHNKNLGKVAITWKAVDVHLGPNPVALFWRPADNPNAPWQPITEQPIENSGKFIWNVPTTVPIRFHVRLDVVDTAGNRGSAESSDGPPVLVDRARPRTRIIGLDPSAHGGGPNGQQLR